ncbi:hypothetical protein FRC02_009291 [Tulasnella sp. 418]|nr:hypothetical protein FRC02_009291 [Tulasnella sp. 418]
MAPKGDDSGSSRSRTPEERFCQLENLLVKQFDPPHLKDIPIVLGIKTEDGTVISEMKGKVERHRNPITTGSLAQIYRGTWYVPMKKDKTKKVDVCIKVLCKTGINEQKYPHKRLEAQVRLNKRLNREVKLWHSLSHPNIIPLCGFKTGTDPWLVMPWYENGDALTWLMRNPKASKTRVLAETAEALKYLHSKDIVHADLKANNVLIKDDGHAVLCDFGVAKIVRDTGAVDYTQAWNYGCVGFIPPESISVEDGWVVVETPRDVYAFGGLIVQLYSGNAPFYSLRNSHHLIIKAIGLEHKTSPREEHPNVPDWAWELAEGCWTTNCTKRPTIAAVLKVLEKKLSLLDAVRHRFA